MFESLLIFLIKLLIVIFTSNPNGGSLDDSDSAAYNFVLCFRDSEGYNAETVVGVLEKVADAAHVLDCLLAANDFDKD